MLCYPSCSPIYCKFRDKITFGRHIYDLFSSHTRAFPVCVRHAKRSDLIKGITYVCMMAPYSWFFFLGGGGRTAWNPLLCPPCRLLSPLSDRFVCMLQFCGLLAESDLLHTPESGTERVLCSRPHVQEQWLLSGTKSQLHPFFISSLSASVVLI